MVEIAKALSRKVKIIVFDEPTAVLSAQDAERLHEIIARLRSEGVGVVYISHRLEEVLSVADRVTVMKDGQVVATRPVEGLTIDEMIRMMVGRPMSALFPEKGERKIGEERLVVRNLHRGRLVRDISFSVRAGEIVGLGGLVGSGRSEVARVIFGADRLDSGAILLNGVERKIRSPSEAVKAGVCLVPEDRKAQGVVLDAPIRVNATMAKLSAVVNRLGFIRKGVERKIVDRSRGEPQAQGLTHRGAGLQPVRRQPAEGCPRQVVSCRRRRRHPRRADARRGCWREERDLWNHPQTRGGRQSGAGDFLRASGALRAVR